MPFQYADADMIPELRRIWADAFPQDGAEEIESFISHAMGRYKCAVWTQDGNPVSMTFLLPAVLESVSAGSLRLVYIYAAATLSEHRGQGIFGRLLTQVHERLNAEGPDACFLHPASQGLFDYYGRYGYQPFFRVVTENYPGGFAARTKAKNENHISYNIADKRNLLLKDHPAWVRWGDDLVNMAAGNAVGSGGAVVVNDGGMAICEPAGDKLFVREWLCGSGYEDGLMAEVSERFPGRDVILRRPAKENEATKSEYFGMIYPLNRKIAERLKTTGDDIPYMGLAFD